MHSLSAYATKVLAIKHIWSPKGALTDGVLIGQAATLDVLITPVSRDGLITFEIACMHTCGIKTAAQLFCYPPISVNACNVTTSMWQPTLPNITPPHESLKTSLRFAGFVY